MSDIERFQLYLEKIPACWVLRTPETNAFIVPHVDVHRFSAYGTAWAVFDGGLMGIVENKLPGAGLADISPFAGGGLAEVIPCPGTATRTYNDRLSFHEMIPCTRIFFGNCHRRRKVIYFQRWVILFIWAEMSIKIFTKPADLIKNVIDRANSCLI